MALVRLCYAPAMSQGDSILAKALELPEEERARLALRLSESLAGETAEDPEGEWAKEIARRIERLRDGTAETVSAAEALAGATAAVASRRA